MNKSDSQKSALKHNYKVFKDQNLFSDKFHHIYEFLQCTTTSRCRKSKDLKWNFLEVWWRLKHSRHWLHWGRWIIKWKDRHIGKSGFYFLFVCFINGYIFFFLSIYKVVRTWSCNQKWLNNYELLSHSWTAQINQKHDCNYCETKIQSSNLPLNSLAFYFAFGVD